MKGLILALSVALLPLSAAAQGLPDVPLDDLFSATRSAPGAVVQRFPTFTLVKVDGLTYYYFTKPSHPAHPGVIRRALSIEDGAWVSTLSARSYGDDDDQPAFKAWLAEIRELDRQMAESLK